MDFNRVEFEQVYNQNWPWLVNYFKSKGLHAEAEDFAQKTFVNAFNSWEKLEGLAALKAWLRAIADNLIKNHWRDTSRQKRQGQEVVPEEAMPLKAPGLDPEAIVATRQELAKIKAHLQKMDAKTRNSFLLQVVHQLDQKSVAQIEGVPVGTIKSRNNRVRRFLKGIVTLFLASLQ